MLFPDLAISDDYQSSNSAKHTLSLTETLNSFYDYIARISLIFKENYSSALFPLKICILSIVRYQECLYFFSGVIYEQKYMSTD